MPTSTTTMDAGSPSTGEGDAPLRCDACGGASRFRCKGCLATNYCGLSCQRAHWQRGGHKHACAKLRKQQLGQQQQQQPGGESGGGEGGAKGTAAAAAAHPSPPYWLAKCAAAGDAGDADRRLPVPARVLYPYPQWLDHLAAAPGRTAPVGLVNVGNR